jgi:hypothetical protein
MKRLWIILSLTFNLVIGQERDLTGRYLSSDNYVIISDSSLEFRTSYGCCVLTDLYGFGKYEILKDTIYVSTEKPSSSNCSKFKILNNLSSSNEISVKVENNGKPIEFCTVTIDDNVKKKIIYGVYTDTSGFVNLKLKPNDHFENKTLTIIILGYDKFQIPVSEIIGKSIEVNLVNYLVLIDRKVAFKIQKDNYSTKLLGPFFPATDEEKLEMKKTMRKRKRQMRTHSWPWNWQYRDTHKIIPTTYVKN